MNLLQLVQCTTYVCISIIPATGEQEESGAFAGIAAGVAVVSVFAVVVVVVAIFLVAMCSTQQRRKRSGRPTDVVHDVVGLEPHYLVLLTYEPISDVPAKVSQTMQLYLLHNIANKFINTIRQHSSGGSYL